jgi:hypothetical protein
MLAMEWPEFGVLGSVLSSGLLGRVLFGVRASIVMVGVDLAFFGVEGASSTGVGSTLTTVFKVVCDVLFLVKPEKWRETDCLKVFMVELLFCGDVDEV